MGIVDDLAKLGVSVQLQGDDLRAFGALNDKTRAMIRENKAVIIAALRERYASKRPEAKPVAPVERAIGPVSLDPVAYLNLAADLIATCPESVHASLRSFHAERLRFWRNCPQVACDEDGPPVMAFNDLDDLCQRVHGVWLAVWYMPDGKFKTEVCRREVTRPAPATSQIENKRATKQAEPALF